MVMVLEMGVNQVMCPPGQQVYFLVPAQGFPNGAVPHAVPMGYAMHWAAQPKLLSSAHPAVQSVQGPEAPNTCNVPQPSTDARPGAMPAKPTTTPSTDSESETWEAAMPLTASAARRQRRKRAAERAKAAQAAEVQAQARAVGGALLSIEQLRDELREDPAVVVQRMRGRVWACSRDAAGCRLVQDVLELGTRDAADLAKELHGHVLEAAMCPYGNYVVQKVVSHLSTASSRFVARELVGNASRVARHRFACRALCRLLEFCPADATTCLVDELLQDVSGLCSHSFAHHVMQSILENGKDQHKKLIADELLSDPFRYATGKNSSYLVEKVLSYCQPVEQDALLVRLGQPEQVLELAKTQYGSYVARALLRDNRVNSQEAMRLIAMHQSELSTTKGGQHFLVDVGLLDPLQVELKL